MIDDVHENPVRKGLVEPGRDWKWSSAAWFVDFTRVSLLPGQIPPEWLADAGLRRRASMLTANWKSLQPPCRRGTDPYAAGAGGGTFPPVPISGDKTYAVEKQFKTPFRAIAAWECSRR
jgi:hypothetical protein